MLGKERLNIELNKAIEWIRDYVSNSGANGVVVRK